VPSHQQEGTVTTAKTSELEIQHAILDLMLDGKVWSNADLKDRLKDTLQLTGADRSVGARPNEALWENRVNNSLAPARASSLYAKGFVVNCGHGLHQISAKGPELYHGRFQLRYGRLAQRDGSHRQA